MQALTGVYRPRQRKNTSFCPVIEEYFEQFDQICPYILCPTITTKISIDFFYLLAYISLLATI